MKPLIGLSAYTILNKENPKSPYMYGQKHTYIESISLAGGIPVIIPISKNQQEIKDVLERLDGVLFAGGNDISPKFYNQELRDAVDLNEPRDVHEIELMKLAFEANLPILAICRGMQLLNVVRGGTLHQDIVKEIPGASNHDGYHKDQVGHLVHTLSIADGTELSEILGTASIDSNSYHHQAVNELGEGLTVNARTDDGIIEGLEDMRQGYIMAVQAHPESMVIKSHPEWLPLFESFIAASRNSKDVLLSGRGQTEIGAKIGSVTDVLVK